MHLAKKYDKYPLKIELVPQTSWYWNVRKLLNDTAWNVVKTISRSLAGDKCEICGSNGREQGFAWTTETHEIWKYDDENRVQELVGIQALCPFCHKTKHWGYTMTKEKDHIQEAVIKHVKNVNGIYDHQLGKYLEKVFRQWEIRSKYKYEVNMDYIYEYIKQNPVSGLPTHLSRGLGAKDPKPPQSRQATPPKFSGKNWDDHDS